MSDDNQNKKGHNPFADQLSDLDIEVSNEPEKKQPQSAPATDSSPPKGPAQNRGQSGSDELSDEQLFHQAIEDIDADEIPAGTDPGPSTPIAGAEAGADEKRAQSADTQPQQSTHKTERDLFREAVDNIDASQIYDAKFRGQSGTGKQLPDAPDDPPDQATDTTDDHDVDEQQTRQKAQQLRDEALFQRMVGDVEPLDERDKYRPPRRSASSGLSAPDSEPSLKTPSLPKRGEGLNYIPPLGKAQKQLLGNHRNFEHNHHVPQLHLRGKTRRKALKQLQDFIADHHGTSARFVRVIPGRGLRSESAPVLKPTVLHWLEGPGIEFIVGYAPERLQGGDYGSLIIELSGADN